MNWDQLLTAKRLGQEHNEQHNNEIARSQFQRDYDRIIFCSPFRRLQNKTQVFPLPGSIFVHNRLTHSLEVASVGRSLGNIISSKLEKEDSSPLIPEIGTIVSTACLAHDLGNPPFGHSGEEAISNYFKTLPEMQKNALKEKMSENQWNDLLNFEGNSNALRVLTHQFTGRLEGGFQLTYSTLASIVKYPCTATLKKSDTTIHRKKYGFFDSEIGTFHQIAKELGLISTEENAYLRHPLVFLVEAADDICYNIIDLEDAQRLKIISFEDTKKLLLNFFSHQSDKEKQHTQDRLESLSDPNEQLTYLRAKVIGLLVMECSNTFWENRESIMKGTFDSDLINRIHPEISKALKKVQKISLNEIYRHRSVVEIEIAGYKVLGGLMSEFCEAILNPDSSVNEKLISLIPKQYFSDNTDEYSKIQTVLDFVSGMTDLYAVDLFKKIKGISIDSL